MQALNNGAGFDGTLPVRSTAASKHALAGVCVARTEADVGVFEADADTGFDDAKTEAHADVVDAEADVVDAGFNIVKDDFFTAKKRMAFSGFFLPLLSNAVSILLNG